MKNTRMTFHKMLLTHCEAKKRHDIHVHVHVYTKAHASALHGAACESRSRVLAGINML